MPFSRRHAESEVTRPQRYFNMPATRVQLWEITDTADMLQIGKQLFGAK